KEACERAVNIFLTTGSHFVANAEWGCSDNVHKAWITAELESKQDALSILPPAFRKDAMVVQLENFSPVNLSETIEKHN
ncbi:MAG: hypothetical protein WEC37_01095, partial [Anaerolineales bacterium]